jgi:hypothetical protein
MHVAPAVCVVYVCKHEKWRGAESAGYSQWQFSCAYRERENETCRKFRQLGVAYDKQLQ